MFNDVGIRPVLVAITSCALLSIAHPRPMVSQERPTLMVGRIPAEGIRLDGAVTEAGWFAADSIAALTMTEPVEGGTTIGRTVVRIIANEKELIVGIVAYDPAPDQVVSFSKQRDPSLQSEDHVLLAFDTFRDGRSGYVFGLNPTGARYDALIAGQGEQQSADWDGIWDAATRVTDVGWSAEIRIPVTTLSFDPNLREWGFNIQRQVQRLQEVSRWASPRRDYQVTQVARAGVLRGLPQFDLGVGVSVRPAIIAKSGVPSPGAQREESFDPSLDITQRVGSNVLASLTLNTDFAEVDVDTRQTNLTRFPLFFPEKRTFFLEGSDIFNFGPGLGNTLVPFHSRRIGLVSGTTVPMDGGIKLNGRAGNANVGALVVRTREEEGVAPATTIGVARWQQNVLEQSSMGALATVGDPLGRSGSWLAGGDFAYRSTSFFGNKNFVAGVWGLVLNRDDLTTGNKTAFGISMDYPNDLWDIYANYKWIGDGFDPSLGFVPRRGVQEYRFGVTYLPRPNLSWMRTWRFELFPSLVTDLDGNWESYRLFTAPINWRFESGERLELNFVQEGEQLVTPFTIDSVVIPEGSYHWQRYRVEMDIAAKRVVSGRLTWWFGPFYSGTLQQYESSITWKPSATLVIEMSGERNVGHLVEGDFTQELIGSRVRVNVSPDLQVNTFVQYDNGSRSVGINTRLRWTFDPFGEFFVVYNHNVADFGDRWGRESNQIVAKIQYAIRR